VARVGPCFHERPSNWAHAAYLAAYWPYESREASAKIRVKDSQQNAYLHVFPVARGGIEPPTFRFSGGGEVKCETFVLVKLDELDQS
jgi:hypothetical protein